MLDHKKIVQVLSLSLLTTCLTAEIPNKKEMFEKIEKLEFTKPSMKQIRTTINALENDRREFTLDLSLLEISTKDQERKSYMAVEDLLKILSKKLKKLSQKIFTINLSGNKLPYIPTYITDFSRTKKLNVSNNNLKQFPQSYTVLLPSLKILDIRKNNLKGLFEIYKSKKELTIIHDDSCKIKRCEKGHPF